MRSCACLHPYEARVQSLEERNDLRTPQLTSDNDAPFRINAVYLKDGLRQIKADSDRLVHGWLLSVDVSHTPPCHMAMPLLGPSTPSMALSRLSLNQLDQRHSVFGHRRLRCRFQVLQPEPSPKIGDDRQRHPGTRGSRYA
jgi:hypothetical protein